MKKEEKIYCWSQSNLEALRISIDEEEERHHLPLNDMDKRILASFYAREAILIELIRMLDDQNNSINDVLNKFKLKVWKTEKQGNNDFFKIKCQNYIKRLVSYFENDIINQNDFRSIFN